MSAVDIWSTTFSVLFRYCMIVSAQMICISNSDLTSSLNLRFLIRYISAVSIHLKPKHRREDNIKTDHPGVLTWTGLNWLRNFSNEEFFFFFCYKFWRLSTKTGLVEENVTWTWRMDVQASPGRPRLSILLVIVREYPCGPTAGRPQYMFSLRRKYSTVCHISTHQGWLVI